MLTDELIDPDGAIYKAWRTELSDESDARDYTNITLRGLQMAEMTPVPDRELAAMREENALQKKMLDAAESFRFTGGEITCGVSRSRTGDAWDLSVYGESMNSAGDWSERNIYGLPRDEAFAAAELALKGEPDAKVD